MRSVAATDVVGNVEAAASCEGTAASSAGGCADWRCSANGVMVVSSRFTGSVENVVEIGLFLQVAESLVWLEEFLLCLSECWPPWQVNARCRLIE
jgi:hypothetical protein